MTYRAGVSPALAPMFPDVVCNAGPEPTVTCDVVNWGTQLVVRAGRGGGPPARLRNGKAPPGWRRFPQPDGRPAQHTCPACCKALGI